MKKEALIFNIGVGHVCICLYFQHKDNVSLSISLPILHVCPILPDKIYRMVITSHNPLHLCCFSDGRCKIVIYHLRYFSSYHQDNQRVIHHIRICIRCSFLAVYRVVGPDNSIQRYNAVVNHYSRIEYQMYQIDIYVNIR